MEYGTCYIDKNVQGLLTIEEEMHKSCSVFGGKVQGIKVNARCETMDDIYRELGFDASSVEWDTYTFGSEMNYDEKKVNYYYPINNGDNSLWQKWTNGNSKQVSANMVSFVRKGYGFDICKGYTNEVLFSYKLPEGTNFRTDPLNYLYLSNGYVATVMTDINAEKLDFYLYGSTRFTQHSVWRPVSLASSSSYSYEIKDIYLRTRPVVMLPPYLNVVEKERRRIRFGTMITKVKKKEKMNYER